MINNRQSFRLRKQFDIHWSIPQQKVQGEAQVFNVSRTGVMIVTDRMFDPEHGMVIHLSAQDIASLPTKGKVMWFKKIGKGRTLRYQCGLKFIDAHNPAWLKWMEDNVQKMADTGDNKILDRFLHGEKEE